jgi:hypothetical protein
VDEKPENIIDFLILEGAVEMAGIDPDTGEMLYGLTEKLESVAPEIFSKIMEQFHREILDLWAQGFLEMNITEVSPMVRITERALDDDAVSQLSRQQQLNLREIIAALRID